VIPFLTPGGRGGFQRPHIQLIYVLTGRDSAPAPSTPRGRVRPPQASTTSSAIGAEWWFGSTSYFRD
jgi:hypothetical protein